MNGESSWLADGVKEIERIVNASVNVEPKIVDLKQEKPGTYAIVTPNGQGGKIEMRVAGPKWHNEFLETPGHLNAFIRSLAELRPSNNPSFVTDPGVVYVSRDRVTYHYSFEDRRDRVTVPLIISKPFAWLSAPTVQLAQRDLIRALRITFAECLPPESSLINLLRNLNFTNNAEANANLQRGREAINRSTLNEVRGVDSLPDEIILNVPVFENAATVATIRCALEVYPDIQKFELIALPSQLHRAMQLALEHILSVTVNETDVKAFLGSNRDQIEKD